MVLPLKLGFARVEALLIDAFDIEAAGEKLHPAEYFVGTVQTEQDELLAEFDCVFIPQSAEVPITTHG